ncbi:MAG: hypothetical protein ABL958_19480, partial [Bdellovibrionia bacterium]
MPSLALESAAPRAGSEPLDVVLMGDFLDQLLKIDEWPERDFRIWVLGTASRDVLVRLLGFPVENIGVIPRYELYPRSPNPLPFPDGSKEWTLVYGGRVVSPKNIDFAIRVLSYLQTELRQPVRMQVFGNVSKQVRLNFHELESYAANYGDKLKEISSSLPLTHPPEFHSALSSDAWLQAAGPNPVCLSLSTYHMEDCGVSVAQAQQLG